MCFLLIATPPSLTSVYVAHQIPQTTAPDIEARKHHPWLYSILRSTCLPYDLTLRSVRRVLWMRNIEIDIEIEIEEKLLDWVVVVEEE